MTSLGVEADMEKQYSEGEDDTGHKLVSPCTAPLSGDDALKKESSHGQKPMEKESPESPSPIKRWEIGSLLQSFKSKMASFTEIVMSPVQLFKPSDSLSTFTIPDQHEQFITESNVESSARTDEEENTDDASKNRLFSNTPSSEGAQCNSASKHHRVAQRLNFDTVPSNNHEPVLDCTKMHDDKKVATNEEESEIKRPSSQPQTVLQDAKQDSSPCRARSPLLRPIQNPSSDKPLNTSSAIYVSPQADVQADITACEHSNEYSDFSESTSLLKPGANSVFTESTKQSCLNRPNPEASSFSTSSGFHSTDENTVRGGLNGSEESCLRMAIRKSPRKHIKHLSETAGFTASSELSSFVTGPRTLSDGMKESQSVNVMEWSSSVEEVSHGQTKRSRDAPTTETKKGLLERGKCNLQNNVDLRPAEYKRKVKDNSSTLEKNQEEGTFVQSRKKRKGISTAGLNIPLSINGADVQMRNSVVCKTSESCVSTEIKEMGRQRTLRSRLRKDLKCRTLLTCVNEGETVDNTPSQNDTRNESINKSLHCRNISNVDDGNYINLGLSEPSLLLCPMEAQVILECCERTAQSRKTRRVCDASSQKRNLRPPKHKFEDSSEILAADPAGPSRPAKKPLLCSEAQNGSSAREKETSLSIGVLLGPEMREKRIGLASPPIQPDSVAPLQSDKERNRRRPAKTVNRQRRKCISIRKRKGVNGGEIQNKTMEAVPVVSLSGSGSNRLLRSYSCPEIPCLVFNDSFLPPSQTHDNSSTSPTKSSSLAPPTHPHSPSKRARRHTVCSVEIEREIAPLCLRKEVYPASRAGLYSGPYHPLCPTTLYSPSTSLSALASCFLSSPLAFLSQNSSQGRSHSGDSSADSAHNVTSSLVTSSSSPSFSSPLTSTLTPHHVLPGTSTVVTPSPEPLCSVFSHGPLVECCVVLQKHCEEAMNADERPDFDLHNSSKAISEEKAFSDSEIKANNKEGHQGKVSSIRIRKKIPKPQNNLTPMGLPKIIRIKKKVFSVEEIYTNKNFSKPADGRLETIYEVPFNRRDGSQAVISQKKVKRFVEFPELGVPRKPKKPLVGIAGGGALRKGGGNSVMSRTRRGASKEEEDGLIIQDLDSLLCSKLKDLDSWMALQLVAC